MAGLPPKKKPKRRLVKKKKKKGAGVGAPQLVARPLAPPVVMSLVDKDPWGYQFATPMWRYEPGISEGLRRDPNDVDRQRVLRVLHEHFELADGKSINQGFNNESIPWGLLREDHKLAPRRKFAERVRAACLKAPGGLLGIAQVRWLLADCGLMSTFVIKSEARTFPLDLTITESILKKTYRAVYSRHLDRVFYVVHATQPPPGRFDPPLCVIDPMRFDDVTGYALARNPKRQPLVSVDTKQLDSPIFKLEVSTTRPLEFREDRQRDPAGTLTDDNKQVGRVVALSKQAAPGITFKIEADLPGTSTPWLALGVVLADLWVQRESGVMHRAIKLEREKVEREKKEAEANPLELPAVFGMRPRPVPKKPS